MVSKKSKKKSVRKGIRQADVFFGPKLTQTINEGRTRVAKAMVTDGLQPRTSARPKKVRLGPTPKNTLSKHIRLPKGQRKLKKG